MCALKTRPFFPDGDSQKHLPGDPAGSDESRGETELALLLKAVSADCIECGLCRKDCQFLRNTGNPKSVSDAFDPSHEAEHSRPFECSLCGLCTSICPAKLDPAALFLEMRKEAVLSAGWNCPEHSTLLDYEKRGTSRRYTWYALPESCRTVFFPGCTLPGTRPDRVKLLFEHLRTTIPDLGIVLDCCTKPSHDLGRKAFFQSAFSEMRDYLLENGVRNVLVACPNCHKVFKRHGRTLVTRTVYEVLAENGLPENSRISGSVTVHDPCAVRFEESIHQAARDLVERTGLTVIEMPHHGRETLCCGEGGAVGFLSPELANNWRAMRKEEAQDHRIITYCAGCANSLGQVAPTSHVLDLIFEPEAVMAGHVKVSRAPVTYWNRIRLKNWFKKHLDAAVTRERTFTAERSGGKVGLALRITVLALLVAAIVAVRMTGATRFLEQEVLRAWIQSCGTLAPLLYMLVYSLAPSLFLPGLPITIVGGILFGPFWGVVYTITGATIGACLAFLISRYLAREWIAAKLTSPRWRRLDEEVQRHGWKVVAFTRLIPLFPFNLLNYAFGLTKIKFLHYAVTTFVCMLPACIAFIMFSSSLLELIRGRISLEFVIGLLLVVLVSLVPVLYRRRRS